MEKPWKTDRSPAFPMKALGHAQLGAQEGAMLYYLARDHFSGTGKIVELGAFLGASASLLGKGLMENPRWDGKARIYSHDVFEATMRNMSEFVRTRIDPEFQDGGSFLPFFEAQTKDIAETIVVCKGDLLEASWTHGDIEILFVDVAKSPALNKAVFEKFFPSLTPGSGLMIHQDFHNPQNPWIHTAMGYLDSFFEVVEDRADDSCVFRLLDRPSAEDIAHACAYHTLSTDEKLARIGKLIRRFETADNREKYLVLTKAAVMISAEEKSQAQTLIEELMARVGTIENKIEDFFWESRCETLLSQCE